MTRDGITETGGTGGPAAGLLRQIIEATPLDTWTEAFAATAAQIVTMPVAEDWAPTLHMAWAAAAVRQRDTAWAIALLARMEEPGRIASLLTVFPGEDRAEVLFEAVVQHRGLAGLVPALAVCPGPWPPRLADAVLRWLVRATDSPSYAAREFLRLAGLRLPVDRAVAVAEVACHHPDDSAWRRALLDVADRITYRRLMLEELQ